MGHHITAFIDEQEVASIHIGGLNRRSTKIYDRLGAEEFNMLDSGSGGSKIFQPIEWRVINPYNVSFEDLSVEENEFLKKCTDALDKSENSPIKILFE